ncbi:hypothetical protein DYB32_009277 [Aphanomyces invadans]|uniref:AB hydrolase-1 domain-containing protein n=1 Tax=Aphanomyces invadans TaxID=157072 RepID=A0A418AIT0_9STRA|nr:hypothetical protein DYB32_009277 [Aphanomyces invadans]
MPCPDLIESKPCDPEPCVLSAWSPLSECDLKTHLKTQTRTVVSPPYWGGAPCDALIRTEACPARDCVLSPWSALSECDLTTQKKTRTRSVVVAAEYGGAACSTELTQYEDCKPVNCKLTPFSDWICNPTTKEKTRSRSIEVMPLYGGTRCQVLSETAPCGGTPCQVLSETAPCGRPALSFPADVAQAVILNIFLADTISSTSSTNSDAMQALFSLAGLAKLVLGERERKKYAFIVYLVHCLHYHWAAKRPTHLQTLMVALSTTAPVIRYDRQLLTLSDGGTVSLDWAIPASSPDDPFHDSHLCCPAYTHDVREVVAFVCTHHIAKGVPLMGIGFSLGANILLKYVGEEGAACLLTAAVSVANPYDFVVTNLHITHSWFHRWVYNAAMTRSLLRMVFDETNAHEHLTKHPAVDIALLRNIKTLTEYDHHVSRHTFGYLTPMDIYRDASSAAYLKHIAIPTLCISAHDDPICPHTAIPYEECRSNPNIVLAVTHSGGHVGFFTSQHLFDDEPGMWCADVIAQYCDGIFRYPDDLQTSVHGTDHDVQACRRATTVDVTSLRSYQGWSSGLRYWQQNRADQAGEIREPNVVCAS